MIVRSHQMLDTLKDDDDDATNALRAMLGETGDLQLVFDPENVTYGRMVGWDPLTGSTYSDRVAEQQFNLGLTSQGIDTRQMVPNPWVPGEMMANPAYGRPWGWDPITGLGTADQAAVDLAAEQYLRNVHYYYFNLQKEPLEKIA